MRKISLLVAFVLALCSSLFSQDSIKVSINVSAPATLDQVNIADLDVSKLSDLPLIFVVTITSNETVEVKLNFQVWAKVGDQPEELLADAWSSPFTVYNVLSFTNQDLASGRAGIKSDRDRTKVYEDKIKRIKEVAQTTGRLPAGTYRFTIRLFDSAESKELARWEKVYEIINPSRIDLVTPGNETEVRTQFPVFKWVAPYLKEFEIYVYEKLPNQTTPEEVVSGDKNLRWKEKVTQTQIQYPQSALTLENGKTYYWFIKSQIMGSRGAEEIRSEIWNFTVKLSQEVKVVMPNLAPEQQKVVNELVNAFLQIGREDIAKILMSIVSDFEIRIDGRPATQSEIKEIIQFIRVQLAELGAEVVVE